MHLTPVSQSVGGTKTVRVSSRRTTLCRLLQQVGIKYPRYIAVYITIEDRFIMLQIFSLITEAYL